MEAFPLGREIAFLKQLRATVKSFTNIQHISNIFRLENAAFFRNVPTSAVRIVSDSVSLIKAVECGGSLL